MEFIRLAARNKSRLFLIMIACLACIGCTEQPAPEAGDVAREQPVESPADIEQPMPEEQAAIPIPTSNPTEAELRAEFAAMAQKFAASQNPYLGLSDMGKYMEVLNDPASDDIIKLQARVSLASQLLKRGEIDAALEQVDEVTAWLDATQASGGFPSVDEERMAVSIIRGIEGLAWLRKAEIENCVERNNEDCCIFPLTGGGVHDVDKPARNAMAAYEKLLEHDMGNRRFTWLLNVAAMAADEWPEGVSERNRLPAESFSDDSGIPRFENISKDLGVNTFNLCGGAIVDDFTGDGLYDIVTSSLDFTEPLHYFVNDGQGGFEDRSDASGLSAQFGGLNCIGTDYDNDGDPDILVLRGGWLRDDGCVRNSLIRNNGDGTFTDVTGTSGLVLPGRPTQAACWHDFNNDGWLDLFVAHESRTEIEPDGPSYPARLWVSNGDGTFTERAQEFGCAMDAFGKGVSAGDYDNDGLVDLYISNVGPNRLYHNLGNGKFEEIAAQQGMQQPEGRSFVPWFFDYDNDGQLDLFVSAYETSIEDLVDQARGRSMRCPAPRLYRNTGNGFTDVATESGLAIPVMPMGASFGDIDNDGWLDMYLATGDPEYETLMPNVMLQNVGGSTFRNATYSGGFGHLQKGHGVAFADIDNDGDQDIYNQLGGFYPGDKFSNALFLNPGNANHWLKIRLEGVQTNRQGYGVRIRVKLATPNGEREIHRAAGSVSSFGGSPRIQEIGLGDATAISELELYWPVSGTRQLFTDVPLDTIVSVSEDADSWEVIELPVISLK